MSTIQATSGRALGSRPAKRLRAEGQLPGVLYGRGIEPVPISVVYTELREVLKGEAGLNTVFQLVVDGTEHHVIVTDIQRDPIKRTVRHADFLRVEDDTKITITIPLELVGKAAEVVENGGMIEQKMHSLKVLVTPRNIPNSIEVDISNMTMDQRLALGDIDLPEGVSTKVPGRITIAAPVVPRGLKSMAEEEEGEGEEGAEAAAEESSDE